MKKLILILFLALLGVSGYAEKREGLDIGAIREAVQDTAYYNKLEWDFYNFKKLTPAEVVNLYHGQVFQDDYSPYDKLIWKPKADKMMEEGKTQEALMYCFLLLMERPAYLPLLNYTIRIATEMEFDQTIIDDLRTNEANLLVAMIASGTGKSTKSPILSASPSDEYLFLDRVLRTPYSRIGVEEHDDRYYDVYQITPTDLFDKDKIYFDITSRYKKTFKFSDMLKITPVIKD